MPYNEEKKGKDKDQHAKPIHPMHDANGSARTTLPFLEKILENAPQSKIRAPLHAPDCLVSAGWLPPLAVRLDEGNECTYRLLTGQAAPHNLPLFVKRNLPLTRAHVSVIRISHLAGTIHDTPHDPYLNSLQVIGTFADFLSDCLQVK